MTEPRIVRRRFIGNVSPSRFRLVSWSIVGIACLALFVRSFLDRTEPETPPLAREPAAAARPPAVRIGALARTAHLPVLSGLEFNLYALAASRLGPIEAVIAERPQDLVRALRDGDIEMAALPLHDAVQLALELGERAPRIVAGIALGDEVLVARGDASTEVPVALANRRLGVLERPHPALAAALGLGGAAAPRILLLDPEAIGKSLSAGAVDFALLPEPFASATAALSGARVLAPADCAIALPQEGAVLVIAARFLAEQPAVAENLVGAHDVACFDVQQDAELALARALALLARVRRLVPPELVWQESLRGARFASDIPDAAIDALLGAARTGMDPAPADSAGFVRRDLIAKARAVADEAAAGK